MTVSRSWRLTWLPSKRSRRRRKWNSWNCSKRLFPKAALITICQVNQRGHQMHLKVLSHCLCQWQSILQITCTSLVSYQWMEEEKVCLKYHLTHRSDQTLQARTQKTTGYLGTQCPPEGIRSLLDNLLSRRVFLRIPPKRMRTANQDSRAPSAALRLYMSLRRVIHLGRLFPRTC